MDTKRLADAFTAPIKESGRWCSVTQAVPPSPREIYPDIALWKDKFRLTMLLFFLALELQVAILPRAKYFREYCAVSCPRDFTAA